MNIHMSKSCTHSHLDLPQVPSLWTGCAVVTQHLEQEPSRRRCGKLTICRSFLLGNHWFSTFFGGQFTLGNWINLGWALLGLFFPKQYGHTWGSYGNSSGRVFIRVFSYRFCWPLQHKIKSSLIFRFSTEASWKWCPWRPLQQPSRHVRLLRSLLLWCGANLRSLPQPSRHFGSRIAFVVARCSFRDLSRNPLVVKDVFYRELAQRSCHGVLL